MTNMDEASYELAAAIAQAANRKPGPGPTVWLASFPKSGNTWVRAIITALTTHEHLFGANHLIAGEQPHHVGAAMPDFGLDPRWLDLDELDTLRASLVIAAGLRAVETENPASAPPFFRKTHEVFRAGRLGAEPFPLEATRAGILIVRDPRAVACSLAPFFGLTMDDAVEFMGRGHLPLAGSPARMQSIQPWGSWSSHARSWLADDVPFPVYTVRYEDMHRNAAAAIHPLLTAVGLECSLEEVAVAANLSRFERMKDEEGKLGFRETIPKASIFFRRGEAEAWRTELDEALVAKVEADHSEVMEWFGYPLTTRTSTREALSQSRLSVRRREGRSLVNDADRLGLTVRVGEIPDDLPGSRPFRSGIHVGPDRVLVHFAGGGGILVEGGADVTVSWPQDVDQDLSWLIHGWALPLAWLQRGKLTLHAASVVINGRVTAIAGHRGSGKSTTAMGLRRRGHRLLVDDATLIDLHAGRAWTTPYPRDVHLLADAAEAVGVDFDALPRIQGDRLKVAFRVEAPPETSLGIDRIVTLVPTASPDANLQVELTRGADRLSALFPHTHRGGLAPLVLGQEQFFALLAELADCTPTYQITRPRDFWSLDQVLDMTENLDAIQT